MALPLWVLIKTSDGSLGLGPYKYGMIRYDFHVWAFNGILMTVQPRLGACFVCLVFKTERHQPKLVSSLVTMQVIYRPRAYSCFLSFSVHEETQHNEKLG